MRKLALSLALVLAPAAALAASLDVPLNQSTFVALPAPAHDVIIGNPAIADVSVPDQRHLIVTGKAAGVTNLVVTDTRGRAIFQRLVLVGTQTGGRVVLINGGQVVSYACAPVCEPVGGVPGAAAGPAPAAPATDTTRSNGAVAASPNIP